MAADHSAAHAERFPFLFGSEYYRSPTPEPECWETDFRAMQDLGFNAVKFFLQWRWAHRAPERFFFEDMDRVMDLAARHGLGVTLNFALDTAPVWLFEVHPQARQVDCTGNAIYSTTDASRQAGGFPGPCYNHPGAWAERRRFAAAAIEHFRGHPALLLWDVWNEPELCSPRRHPELAKMVCYCPHCLAAFPAWLRNKYGSLERLNAVWGRCYEKWEQTEAPRNPGTVTDFVDWREFHLDTMAAEAAWRLDLVRQLDPRHGRYLHVVPNAWFSAVSCADDFALARDCEVFAATMNGQPESFIHVLSAARGKVCYNVESHIDGGALDRHQRILGRDDLLRDFLPQLGAGIKGILFWQYRSETLGTESPAWGLVRLDGSPRPVTEAVREFWATVRPYAAELRTAFPSPAEVGVWRSRKNEIFHFCVQGTVRPFAEAIDACLRTLYWNNLPTCLVNDEMLAAGQLDGLKLLVMPNCYYVTQAEADALDRWVRAGGVLVCEAHLAGYNGSTGRHSRVLPGCGLAEAWGLRETETTASCHLRTLCTGTSGSASRSPAMRSGLKKFAASEGKFFPIELPDGKLICGAHRYAELGGRALTPLGTFTGEAPCLARLPVGQGTVLYCGTNLAQAAGHDAAGLTMVLRMAAQTAGLEPVGGVRPQLPGTVHLDVLAAARGPQFAVLICEAARRQTVSLRADGTWKGLFSGLTWELKDDTKVSVPAGFADMFRIEAAREAPQNSLDRKTSRPFR